MDDEKKEAKGELKSIKVKIKFGKKREKAIEKARKMHSVKH